jgi:hypothetical protein
MFLEPQHRRVTSTIPADEQVRLNVRGLVRTISVRVAGKVQPVARISTRPLPLAKSIGALTLLLARLVPPSSETVKTDMAPPLVDLKSAVELAKSGLNLTEPPSAWAWLARNQAHTVSRKSFDWPR